MALSLLRATEDGLEIVIDRKRAGPVMTVRVPAPMMSEADRMLRVQRAREQAWLKGLWVARETLAHNPVFDGTDEKTTTQMVLRPCRNEREAGFVLEQVRQLLEEHVTEQRVEARERDL